MDGLALAQSEAAVVAAGLGGGPLYSRAIGRSAGELLGALADGAPPPSSSLLVLESRLPTWDENASLLTLDFPPDRASLASVQNFQLVPMGSEAAAAAAAAAQDSLAFSAALVHGLIGEAAGLEQDDAAAIEPGRVAEEEGDARRLARARRCHEDGAGAAAERVAEARQHRVDGQDGRRG